MRIRNLCPYKFVLFQLDHGIYICEGAILNHRGLIPTTSSPSAIPCLRPPAAQDDVTDLEDMCFSQHLIIQQLELQVREDGRTGKYRFDLVYGQIPGVFFGFVFLPVFACAVPSRYAECEKERCSKGKHVRAVSILESESVGADRSFKASFHSFFFCLFSL